MLGNLLSMLENVVIALGGNMINMKIIFVDLGVVWRLF